MAKNMISSEFKTAERPLAPTRSKFPYNDLIHSLKVLDRTKAVIFEENEINYGNITMIKKLVEKHKIGFLKHCKQHGKTYIWVADRVVDI